jgi:hypothetical protein
MVIMELPDELSDDLPGRQPSRSTDRPLQLGLLELLIAR